MKEEFRPIHQSDKPKQNTPEAGAGPLGLPPPGPEQQPLPTALTCELPALPDDLIDELNKK